MSQIWRRLSDGPVGGELCCLSVRIGVWSKNPHTSWEWWCALRTREVEVDGLGPLPAYPCGGLQFSVRAPVSKE